MAASTHRCRCPLSRFGTKALLLTVVFQKILVVTACGSCLLSLSVAGSGYSGRGGGHRHNRPSPATHVRPAGSLTSVAPYLGFIAAQRVVTEVVGRRKGLKCFELGLFAAKSDGDGETSGLFDEDGDIIVESPADRGVPERSEGDSEGATSASMVAAIGFYKSIRRAGNPGVWARKGRTPNSVETYEMFTNWR